MTDSKTVNGKTYFMTFQDDFDQFSHFEGHGSGGIWATSFSPHLEDTRYIEVNGENQYYADPNQLGLPNPFSVRDGILSINAHPLTDAQQTAADGKDFVSGLLTTELSFGAEQGYVEISANVPDQEGFLSAFWLLPLDGDWSAEIDVFETLGRRPDLLNTNVWDHGEGNQISIPTVDMSNGFHTYGLEWTAEEITWYIDDVPMRTVPNTVGEKMYLVASLAVDTTWTGPTDATTNFNDAFQIDYIHVYETDDPGNNPAVTGTQIFAEPIVYGEGAGPETLFGTGWGDLFKGGGADDKLYGRDGDDDLEGGKGADTLHGQTGNDHLKGQGGDDKLIGGEGLDVLDGGKGTDHMWGGSWTEEGAEDRFVFRPGDGKDFVHDFEAGVDLIDLSAYNVDWPTLQNHFESQGWATTIDLASIGGVAGDLTFLVGVDINDLTQDDFVL